MKYHYPRIKPIYPLYKLNKKNFRVGAQLGITTEFDDEKGQFWILSNLMDGFRTFKQIVFEMKNIYPELTSIDIEKGIDLLNEEGLVEETYPGKTIDERYIANVNYFSRFCGAEKNRFEIQEKINNLNILLLGLGGGGSNIVTLLAGLGPKMIRMVDYDKIEPSNLGRQLLYREKDVGEKKTDIAKRAVREMNSQISVETIDKKIVEVEDVIELTEGIDIVICAIDEPPFIIHRIVNGAIIKAGIPCIFGASQISRGRVYTVIPNITGCFDCMNLNFSKNDPKFIEQFVGFREIKFAPPSIAYGPGIFQLTASIVDELIKVVTGYAEPKSLGTQFEINYEDGSSFTHKTWPRFEDDCPTCGNGNISDWEIFQYYKEKK
ncbi:MAG: ThiF family adenylyltransferase [Brochothrix thermosphacta]|uniref:ThiF family adenylyltransferase n=1 Tax=Brochothrix thermosphacta TaxID=2756 RepID=UPI000D798292|nr:ThiF family adenylyltransferase [Brochothrix thermosphacta]SPP28020.1 ThiF family protein [Brochothrix thermosphacta]